MTRLLTQFAGNVARTGGEIYARVSGNGYTAVRPASASGWSKPYAADPYDVRDQMLAGTVYRTKANGGHLGTILRDLGKPFDATVAPVVNYYNPVPAIVGCYANALGGRLGRELELETPDKEPVDQAVSDAVARLWRWSNLDGRLPEITALTANQGTAGLRVVQDLSGAEPRVYVQPVHPRDIADAEEDDRGNLRGVLLRYTTYYQPALGEAYEAVEVEEYIGRDGHSRLVGGVQQLDAEERTNPLGVCPFVLMHHARRHGDLFGRHAYEGSENAIHGLNWTLSQIDEAAARMMAETVLMTGAGDKPSMLTLGRLQAFYVKLANGVPPPGIENIFPQLPIDKVGAAVLQNIELLWTRQPELILNALKLLSGTSGETLAQVLKPVEAVILRARRNYEDAMVRALQIGLSLGVMLRTWDLGTGMGTRDAADRAYDDGQGPEAFGFKDRSALPLTPWAKQANAMGEHADAKERATVVGLMDGLVPQGEKLKLLGYSEEDAERLAAELAAEVVPPTDEGVPADGEETDDETTRPPGRPAPPRR